MPPCRERGGGRHVAKGANLVEAPVLEAHPTPGDLVGLAFDSSGALWASHGNSSFSFELHTIDLATGAQTSTLPLSEPVIVSDLANR